jgi:hypothetical protein
MLTHTHVATYAFPLARRADCLPVTGLMATILIVQSGVGIAHIQTAKFTSAVNAKILTRPANKIAMVSTNPGLL